MDPKVILTLFSDSEEDQSVLRYALSLAEEYDAAVQALHVLPDPSSPTLSYLGADIMLDADDSARKVKELNEECRRAAEESFFVIARNKKAKKASFHSVTGDAGKMIAARGRVSDLIVMGRREDGLGDLPVNDALFGSGRPVLLLPTGSYDGKFNDSMLIAWNGSREAAQAVAFAIPYMKRGRAWVLMEQDEEALPLPLSIEDLTRYLRQHGVATERTLINIQNDISLPESILNTARTLQVGMLVMGAWGHSRLQEYMLGGVTRHMLEKADVPLFLMH